MEAQAAQAAAQKLAAQHVAQVALRGLNQYHQQPMEATEAAAIKQEEAVAQQPPSSSSLDEPTDLTMDAEEKALRVRERMEREQRYSLNGLRVDSSNDDRDREQHEPRHQFDFRHLIPQVSIKTE
jgi:hypothetical protein